MNTIQEAIDSGACTHMGPITIDKDYGTGQNPKSPRRMMVRDDSGKTLLKLWGTARNANITDGDLIEVRALGDKGVIEMQLDQQNRKELSANNVIVEVVGRGASKAVARATTRATAAVANRPDPVSMKELIDYGMQCVAYAQRVATAKDIPFGDYLSGQVFGSAMYGHKEGRRLTPGEPPQKQQEQAPPPPPPQRAAPPIGASPADEFEEEDDIPF